MKIRVTYWAAMFGIGAQLMVGGSPGPAFGAERPSLVDTIKVTARKQEESLFDVPVSATILDRAAVDRYNTTTFEDLGNLAPQVEFLNVGSGSGGSLQIRGLGSASGDSGIEQSVIVNIDGFSITRGRVVKLSFFDIEAVEILKGPQALFFGKNSPGGVVVLRSAGPTDEWEGYGRVGYEFNAREWYGEAAISGPISEKLGLRLAVRGHSMRGWVENVAQPIDNPFQPDFPLPGAAHEFRPGSEDIVTRLTLSFAPTDSFDAVLRVFFGRYTDNGEELTDMRIRCADGLDRPTVFGVPDPFGTCGLDKTTSKGAQPRAIGEPWPLANDGVPFSRVETWLTTLEMNYRAGDWTFTTVTGLLLLDSDNYDISDDTVYAQLTGLNNEEDTNFSQEIRAFYDSEGPVNLLVGVFYESADRDWYNSGKIAPLPVDPATGKYHTWEQIDTFQGKSMSVFAQVQWDITPKLELAGGARYTYDKKNVVLMNRYVHPGLAAIFLPEGQALPGTFKDDNVSPEVTLTWRVQDAFSLYGAFKTGYKSGGFSTPGVLDAGRNEDTIRFESEQAIGGEIGAKFAFLDGNLVGDATIYRYDFDDLQLTAFDAETTSFTIQNAAKMRTQGVELQLQWQATAELQVHGALGYNDAKFVSFPGAPCYLGQTPALGCVNGIQDLSGERRGLVSKWEWQAGFLYDRPIANGLVMGLSLDVRYRSKYEGNDLGNPVATQPSLVLVDASVRVYADNDSWELAVIGKNLTNEFYVTGAGDPPGGQLGELSGYLQRTRQIILQGTARF